ncbi:MAG: hypothetical protein QMD22_11445, partial [archaeon]|nr:hypothetical protein [archaeon]
MHRLSANSWRAEGEKLREKLAPRRSGDDHLGGPKKRLFVNPISMALLSCLIIFHFVLPDHNFLVLRRDSGCEN